MKDVDIRTLPICGEPEDWARFGQELWDKAITYWADSKYKGRKIITPFQLPDKRIVNVTIEDVPMKIERIGDNLVSYALRSDGTWVHFD